VLEVEVRHSFNGDPLLLDSLRYENAAKEPFRHSASYFLSGFALEENGRRMGGTSGSVAWMIWFSIAPH